MNYQKIYDSLINRARYRKLNCYIEKHHIIPKCMNGTNNIDNIVELTPEEHYLAHLLLVKIYPTNYKLVWAASAMTNSTEKMERSNNKRYGWFRKRFSQMLSDRFTGREVSEESRKKQSEARKGRKFKPHTEETKLKMSLASKGKPKSESHKKSLSNSKKGKTGTKRSSETKIRMSEAQQKVNEFRDHSYKQNLEYKQLQSQKMKEVWAKRKAGKLPMPFGKTIKGNNHGHVPEI